MPEIRPYEEQILKELKTLPEEALPKVLRLLIVVREEFLEAKQQEHSTESLKNTNHERIQQLLSTSQGNWAQELSAEREDRL
jgi:hypothetical protein